MLTWKQQLIADLDGHSYTITEDEDGWAVEITDPDGGVMVVEVCSTIEEAKAYCENTAADFQSEE